MSPLQLPGRVLFVCLVSGGRNRVRAPSAGAVAVKYEVTRALSAIVSVFWVDSVTNNVPAPADHALEPSVMKDLAEKSINEVTREISCYDHQACKQSSKALMDGLTKSLVDLSKPFKYIGVCAPCLACLLRCLRGTASVFAASNRAEFDLPRAVSCTFLQRHPAAANTCGPFGTWDPAIQQDDGAETGDLALPEEGPFKVHGAAAGGFYTSTSALWDTSTDRSVTVWRDISAGKGLRCIVTAHACYEGQYAEQRPQPEPAPESEDALA